MVNRLFISIMNVDFIYMISYIYRQGNGRRAGLDFYGETASMCQLSSEMVYYMYRGCIDLVR